jgi:hypothetical protein
MVWLDTTLRLIVMKFIKLVVGDLLLQIHHHYHHLIQDSRHLPVQEHLVGQRLLAST